MLNVISANDVHNDDNYYSDNEERIAFSNELEIINSTVVEWRCLFRNYCFF